MKWKMEQDWNHVLFLHWRVPADVIRPHVPFELDLFEGDAVLSIVPFQMNRIRFPPFPVVSFFSSLWELNLRTYVKVNGVRGVYFFTLDTDSAFGCFIANRFFHLPYRLASMHGRVKNNEYQFESKRDAYCFQMRAEIAPGLKKKTKLDQWATDQSHLFTRSDKHIFQGTVIHLEWSLQAVQSIFLQDRFSCQLPVELKRMPDEIAYCRHLKVSFKPFQTI